MGMGCRKCRTGCLRQCREWRGSSDFIPGIGIGIGIGIFNDNEENNQNKTMTECEIMMRCSKIACDARQPGIRSQSAAVESVRQVGPN